MKVVRAFMWTFVLDLAAVACGWWAAGPKGAVFAFVVLWAGNVNSKPVPR